MDATENKVVPSDDLPPLPEPWIIDGTTNDPTARHHYAEDQLIDYARTYNAALRADLDDSRSNWEAGAEELRQADLVREQLAAALKIGRDVMALVGVQDHLIDYDAVSKGRKIVADALTAVDAVDLKGGA